MAPKHIGNNEMCGYVYYTFITVHRLDIFNPHSLSQWSTFYKISDSHASLKQQPEVHLILFVVNYGFKHDFLVFTNALPSSQGSKSKHSRFLQRLHVNLLLPFYPYKHGHATAAVIPARCLTKIQLVMQHFNSPYKPFINKSGVFVNRFVCAIRCGFAESRLPIFGTAILIRNRLHLFLVHKHVIQCAVIVISTEWPSDQSILRYHGAKTQCAWAANLTVIFAVQQSRQLATGRDGANSPARKTSFSST